MRFSITVAGAKAAVQLFEELNDNLTAPLGDLMDLISQEWASTFQRQISEGQLTLPPPHPVTEKIRAYYGHADKARLIRGADLLHSIEPLETGDDYLVVGSNLDYASTLMFGGLNRTGKQVQPHPFMILTDKLLDDTDAQIADYIFGEE